MLYEQRDSLFDKRVAHACLNLAPEVGLSLETEPKMNPAYFSAFAALDGSIIGGLTSLATSWLSQRAAVMLPLPGFPL